MTIKQKYKIYRKSVENGVECSSVLKTVEYNTHYEVIEEVRKLREEYNCNDIYWNTIDVCIQLDDKGKPEISAESLEDLHNKLKSKISFIEKFFGFFSTIWYRLQDKCSIIKRGFQRMFVGYTNLDAYNINTGLLRYLMFNLPKMIENLHSYPDGYNTIAKSIVDSHPDTFIAYDKNTLVSNIAFGIWKSRLEDILLQARLYYYYSNFGIQDNEPEYNCVNTIKYPIPKYEFTENRIDYDKLSELMENARLKLLKLLDSEFEHLWD